MCSLTIFFINLFGALLPACIGEFLCRMHQAATDVSAVFGVKLGLRQMTSARFSWGKSYALDAGNAHRQAGMVPRL